MPRRRWYAAGQPDDRLVPARPPDRRRIGLSLLIVVVPIAATYAGLIEIDVGTGLLTVVLAAGVGFLALDSIPGRWF